MIDKIITKLTFYFLNRYIDITGYDETLLEMKTFMFDNKYSEYAAEGKTASETYAILVSLANSGSIKALHNYSMYRELRREKSYKYKKLDNLVTRRLHT